MDDELSAQYSRWRRAEEAGDGEDADRAFKAVFEASVIVPLPSRDFTANTVAAVASAAAEDARRARRAKSALRWTVAVGGAAAVYFGTGPALSAMSSALVAALNLVISAIVGVASGSSVSAGLWGLLTAIGRAAAAFVADPRVTVAMIAFQGLAVAALIALHRLLGSDRELLR
jgi:hypothetical protein